MTGSMVDEYIPIEMRDQADNSTELIDIKTKYIYSVSLLVLKLKPERERENTIGPCDKKFIIMFGES